MQEGEKIQPLVSLLFRIFLSRSNRSLVQKKFHYINLFLRSALKAKSYIVNHPQDNASGRNDKYHDAHNYFGTGIIKEEQLAKFDSAVDQI